MLDDLEDRAEGAGIIMAKSQGLQGIEPAVRGACLIGDGAKPRTVNYIHNCG